MNTPLNNAGIYTSFSGLTELKAGARKQSPEARKEVARQFEAMFIQIMLKSMREASEPGSDGEGEQVRFYQEMFDQQIALDLARNKSMGLADSFERQLQPAVSAETSVSLPSRGTFIAETSVSLPSRGTFIAPRPEMSSHQPIKQNEPAGPTRETGATRETASSSWMPADPEEFVRRLWPAARKVAESLGLMPEVLVAQAVLETGWGKSMPADRQGSSMNLFGIKADGGWKGRRVGVSTMEYRQGSMLREHAEFRSYDSPEASMEDYARFLQENPRYRQALENTGDSLRYLQELQKAGYATDPDYAGKIHAIMNSERFNGIVDGLRAG